MDVERDAGRGRVVAEGLGPPGVPDLGALVALRVTEEELHQVGAAGLGLGDRVGLVDVRTDQHAPSLGEAAYASRMRLERTVRTDRPVGRVFAYLSDFTNTEEWDPGTVETVLVSGDGGVGTDYRNTSRFAGRESSLTYTVVERVVDERLVLRGRNRSVTVTDTMRFTALPDGAGTEVRYTADFDFGLLTPLLAVVLWLPMKKLGDDAERGLREALGRL